MSPFVCYDLRFPEIFRAAVHRGAEVLVVIACWPTTRREHWTALLKARAIENQAYVVGVNRCGRDPKLSYSGQSMIVGPKGDVLAFADDQETVLSADLSRDVIDDYRDSLPFLKDRRPDFRT